MITCQLTTLDMIEQDMELNDNVTQSVAKPGEESAEGEDATENGRSQGETCFHIRIEKCHWPHHIYR